MQQQSTPLVLTSTSYHQNADVERPLLNSAIDRSGSSPHSRRHFIYTLTHHPHSLPFRLHDWLDFQSR